MATAIKVEAAVPGRRRAGTAEHALTVPIDEGSTITVRQLVDAVVRAEVAAFESREEERTLVKVLTEGELAEGIERGAVRSGGVEPSPPVDVDAAVATALAAHADGLYSIIVDDAPIDDLDAVVSVSARTRLLFLRLVPLAGG